LRVEAQKEKAHEKEKCRCACGRGRSLLKKLRKTFIAGLLCEHTPANINLPFPQKALKLFGGKFDTWWHFMTSYGTIKNGKIAMSRRGR
jgi:hypothetical protein